MTTSRTSDAPSNLSERVALLRAHELFHGVPDDFVARIGARLPMMTARRGTVVYHPGVTPEGLFLLKTGRVALYRLTGGGRKVVVGILEPGATFGDMPTVAQRMGDTFAEAIEDSAICVMSRQDIQELLREHPSAALAILHSVARRLRAAEDELENVAVRSVPARLARLLLRLARNSGRIEGFTHQELAELLGTTRETVWRTLNEFERAGLVTAERRFIAVADVEGLERRAAERGSIGEGRRAQEPT
ncbi:HTH-type transcriptional regulator Cmr [bacterium HR29]|jgi:CRP/FNR family cyclic AMP-dependent transcriptional regulator|nr:HTH-type transcriptional regulator Cmr [bacterium HR29]